MVRCKVDQVMSGKCELNEYRLTLKYSVPALAANTGLPALAGGGPLSHGNLKLITTLPITDY